MTSLGSDLEELVKELIVARFPHLRGSLTVRITARELLYEVSKDRSGLLVEIGPDTLSHTQRREIILRCGCVAQEIHSGFSSARRVTGLDEIHS